MPPVPPSTGRIPQPLPATNQAYYQISDRNLGAGGKFDVRGPFLGRHVPTSGALVVQGTKGTQIQVDDRVWLPISSGVAEQSVIQNMVTGRKSTVVFVKPYGDEVECYVKHMSPT